jgi:hypothetical protein
MRRVPRNYPATPLLHFGNASLGHNCTIEVGVARPECSADMECDTYDMEEDGGLLRPCAPSER